MSAFGSAFRKTWSQLGGFMAPALRAGIKGVLLVGGLTMLLTGIYLSWFADQGPVPDPGGGLFEYSVVPVAQEAMAQAVAAHGTHAARLLDQPGVVAAGVGLDALGLPALKVYVSEFGIASLPATLDGVNVEVDAIGEVWAWGDAPAELSATTQAKPASRFERPVPIGVSAGHPSITAGTIGARVTDGKQVFALSNNHVFAAENRANIDDRILQPGPVDGGQNPRDAFGTLVDFEPVKFTFGSSNTMDAAIALSTVDDLGNATLDDGYGTPASETTSPRVLMGVKKYGRTTGFTQGKVDAIMATVNVRYNAGTARFVDQVLIKPGGFSAGGDSGSLVVGAGGADDGKPVALVFAGSSLVSIANPIEPVLERFGVTIDGK